jgi:signal transduction histidine kinase
MPVGVTLGGLAVTLALSASIGVQERDHIGRIVSGEAEATARAIQTAVTSHIQALTRIEARWGFHKPSRLEWEIEARKIIEQSYGFEIIEWLDSSFETQWSVYTGGKKTVDAEAAFGAPLKDTLRNARERRSVAVSRAIELPNRGTGILIYVPVFLTPDAESFDGFITAVLNLQSIMTGLLDVNFVRLYDIEILEKGKPIYAKPGAQDSTKKEWAREAESKLYGVDWPTSSWTVRVWPTARWLQEMRSSLGRFVLGAGLVSSGLLALLTFVYQLARSRAQLLEATNAKLKREMEERVQAEDTLAHFITVIVHDLRSPLSNVISILEGMNDGLFGPVAEDQLKWLKKGEMTARGCAELINDFLDLSKLEAGHIDLKRQAVDLRQLLRASIDNYALAAKAKNIMLSDEIDRSLPTVEADPQRIEQVMTNLLSNALKFTLNGGQIVVGAKSNKKEIAVWVKDSGVGISSDEIGLIFEKYKQTTSGMTSQYKGTGLGLVICKMIVEAHGGIIRAESERGTTFTFTLPTA